MKKISILFLLIAFAFSSCTKVCKDCPAILTYKVKYTMVCTDCEVVYVSDTSGTQTTEYHKNSSWSYTFNGKKNQQLLFLAYNTSSVMQGVTATISVNDSVVATQTNYCPVSGNAFVVDTIQ